METFAPVLYCRTRQEWWLNHGNRSKRTKTYHFLREALLWALVNSMHTNIHCGASPSFGTWTRKKVEELFYLLEVKDDLDRTDWKKKIDKNGKKLACIWMWPRMHFLDLQQLDHWLNGCVQFPIWQMVFCCFFLYGGIWWTAVVDCYVLQVCVKAVSEAGS